MTFGCKEPDIATALPMNTHDITAANGEPFR
jgi:hypothetical protein